MKIHDCSLVNFSSHRI